MATGAAHLTIARSEKLKIIFQNALLAQTDFSFWLAAERRKVGVFFLARETGSAKSPLEGVGGGLLKYYNQFPEKRLTEIHFYQPDVYSQTNRTSPYPLQS